MGHGDTVVSARSVPVRQPDRRRDGAETRVVDELNPSVHGLVRDVDRLAAAERDPHRRSSAIATVKPKPEGIHSVKWGDPREADGVLPGREYVVAAEGPTFVPRRF